MRLLVVWMTLLVGAAYIYFATLSRFAPVFVGVVLIFLVIRKVNPIVLSESAGRALRLGMIAVGIVLLATGVVTFALLFTPARAFMPEAELFAALGTFPPTPWGTFVWFGFYIGLYAGILLLGLALTNYTHLLASPSQNTSE